MRGAHAQRGNLYIKRRVPLFGRDCFVAVAPRHDFDRCAPKRVAAELKGERNCTGFLRQT
ncbi:MAG: hypothetical protein LBL66_07905 [Clostridiales bacterium]|nr:hypothetical protein [Clostridiales bacterium]